MADDTKRIVIGNFADVAAGVGTSVQLLNPDNQQTNLHNIWFSVCVNPKNADANVTGQWVLYREEDITRAIFVPSVANINLETINYKIIACGCFMGSNQKPVSLHQTLGKTSRNVKQNGRLILACIPENMTAGNAEIELMICSGSKLF